MFNHNVIESLMLWAKTYSRNGQKARIELLEHPQLPGRVYCRIFVGDQQVSETSIQ